LILVPPTAKKMERTEAKRAGLEAEATALLRADARRRKAAHRPKPKPKPTPTPTPPASGWMPLQNLRRALRSKTGNGRAGK
jgi:hypothetical protein